MALSNDEQPNIPALAAELLSLPADECQHWIATHRDLPGVALLEAMKEHADSRALSDPAALEDARRAFLVAEHRPHEPLAYALAFWIQGNAEMFIDPSKAIGAFEQALPGYRAAGDRISVARLLGNLVPMYAECGHFDQATTAYVEGQAICAAAGDAARIHLRHLEQNYGWLLHCQGRYAEALQAYERALTLAHQLDEPMAAAEIRVNQAVALGMLGRLNEGVTALHQERAVVEALEPSQPLTLARIDMDLADFYADLGRPADALRRFRSALRHFASLSDTHQDVGAALLYEARLFERIGALKEAQHNYAEAVARFEAGGLHPYRGDALIRQAAVSRMYGRYDLAALLLDEAEQLWQHLDHPFNRALVHLERVSLALEQQAVEPALSLLQQPLPCADNAVLQANQRLLHGEAYRLLWEERGEPAHALEARTYYDQAVLAAQNLGDRWIERQALTGLARLTLAEDSTAARALLERVAAHDDMTRRALSVEELKAGFQQQYDDVWPMRIRLETEQQQPAQALQCIWRAKGSAILDLLYTTRQAPGTPDAVSEELERIRDQLASQRRQIALEHDEIVPGGEGVWEREDPTIIALEKQLFDLRCRRNAPAATEIATLLGNPQALLNRMESDILIEYVRCDEMVLAAVAYRDGRCQIVELGDTTTINRTVRKLLLKCTAFVNAAQNPATRQQHNATWAREWLPLLKRCYDFLIAPLGPLAAGAKLLVAPCDVLQQLPFAALWDGESYLIERHEIEQTPTGALLAAPGPSDASLDVPLVIVSSAEGALDHIESQAAAVTTAFPTSRAFVDEAAGIATLRKLSRPPRLLHITGHRISRDDDAPIFSALQLPGGMLSVEECYHLALAGTELVTLNGCTTAAGLDSGGSILAFQTALFTAGVQRVLSSLWQIFNEDAAVWMQHFYRVLSEGFSPPAALRQTQLTLREDSIYGHPAVWAAFTCNRR